MVASIMSKPSSARMIGYVSKGQEEAEIGAQVEGCFLARHERVYMRNIISSLMFQLGNMTRPSRCFGKHMQVYAPQRHPIEFFDSGHCSGLDGRRSAGFRRTQSKGIYCGGISASH